MYSFVVRTYNVLIRCGDIMYICYELLIYILMRDLRSTHSLWGHIIYSFVVGTDIVLIYCGDFMYLCHELWIYILMPDLRILIHCGDI